MADTPVASPFLSLSDASQFTGLAERTLRRFIAEGDLPAYRVGKRQIRIKRSDCEALMTPIPTTGTAS